MNINKVRGAILATHGKIFRVSFRKRHSGEVRHMRARLGVTKHLRGGIRAYDPKQYDLVTCFDMEKRDYRSIALEGVFQFRCGQKKWSAT